MSLTLCPLPLKWSPVAFVLLPVLTYPLCSENRSLSVLSDSPIYCWGHFLHPNKYIIFLLEQSTLEFISILKLVYVDFTVFPSLTNEQTLHLLHFFMPGTFLFLNLLAGGGTFDLISLSLMFGGLL